MLFNPGLDRVVSRVSRLPPLSPPKDRFTRYDERRPASVFARTKCAEKERVIVSSFEILTQGFVTIFVTEMGDKTQLLALVLASRFRRPWPVMAGILAATILNHLLAASVGVWLSLRVSPTTLAWVLAAAFVGFAIWVLIPDKADDEAPSSRYGAFLTTLVAFFVAEMGDKTQLSTIALAAQSREWLWVTMGTTAGMMAADGLAVAFGERLTRIVPMVWIHRAAALLFLAYAAWILIPVIF